MRRARRHTRRPGGITDTRQRGGPPGGGGPSAPLGNITGGPLSARAARAARTAVVCLFAAAISCGAWGCGQDQSEGDNRITIRHRDDRIRHTTPQYLDETLRVTIRGFVFTAEVARTPEEIDRGLMHRPRLPDDAAMLFVFPDRDIRFFWMRDTPEPLTIAYIDDNGVIASIHDTVPFSEEIIESDRPIRLVLEVGRGRLDAIGARAGDRVSWEREP